MDKIPNVIYSEPKNIAPSPSTNFIVEDVQRQTVGMSPVDIDNLYSMKGVENIGVDNRIPTMVFDVDRRDVYDTLSDGTQISRYKNYIPGTNNEERLALQQTAGEQWKYGFQKLLGKTGTSVLGGTIGTVNGLISLISQGSISAIYDNNFNRWLDDLNKKMDYNLPNYYTQQQQDYSLMRQMWTANFWADEVFQGLSFTLGMLVSEGIWAAATGGTSLIARGASAAALRGLSKSLGRKGAQKALSTQKNIGKNLINSTASRPMIAGDIAKGAIDAGRQATIRAGRIVDTFHKGRVIWTSAGYEGGVEARHYMMEAEEEYIQNFINTQGREPSIIELNTFRNNIVNSGNAVFASNIALVGGTNIAVFGKSLLGTRSKGTFKNSWVRNNILGVGYKKTGATISSIIPNKTQKVLSKSYDILRPMFLEGVVEEGGQNIIASTAKNYMLSAYNPDSTSEAISFIDAVHEGFADTFGTKEGQKEMLIGAIIGILGGGMQSGFRFNETSQERKAIEDMSKYYNAFTSKNLIDNIIYNNKVKAASEMSDEAYQRGDTIGGEIGNDAALVAKIERDYAFEGVEQGAKDFEAYLIENIDKIAEELGISEKEAREFIGEQVDSYREFADEYTKNRQFAETVYGVTEFREFQNSGFVRDNIVRATATALTIGKNADIRATGVIKEIQELLRDKLSTTDLHKTLTVVDALRRIGRNAHDRYTRASNRLMALEEQLEKVRNRVAELNQTTEMSEAQAAERAKLVERMIELEGKVKTESEVKFSAYTAMNLRSVSDENITQEDLDGQQKSLEELIKSIEALEGTDAVLYSQVHEKLNEYKRAVDYATSYLNVANEMISPTTRARELNNYASKWFGKKSKLNESEEAFFRDVIKKWSDDNIATTFLAQLDSQQDTEETEPTDQTEATPSVEEVTPKEREVTQEDIIREEMDTLHFDTESKRWRTNKRVLPHSVNTRRRAQKYVRDSYKEGFIERDGISEDEYKNFVDTGNVSSDIITYLAEKSIEPGTKLTKQEQAIYNDKISEIENYLRNKRADTVIESLKSIRDKIRELLDKNAYTKIYRGEDLNEMAKTRPSEEDITEFEKFLKGLTKSDIDTINRYQDYTPLEEKGFSEEEVDRFIDLNLKLGEWYILDGISEGGNSISDLLMLMEQYQIEAEQLGVNTEMTQDNLITIKNAPDTASRRYNSSNPVQTPDKVKIKLSTKGKYEISHLNVTSLEKLIPGATVHKISETGELAKVDKNNIYNEGDKYLLSKGDQKVIVEIGIHSRLIVEKEIFDSIISDSNIRIVSYGSNINFDMYVRLEGETVFTPLDGDFHDSVINPEISSEVRPGDKVLLEVDTNNPFNKKLIRKIKRTKNEAEKKKLIGQLVIHVKTENGEVFGQLRGYRDGLTKSVDTSVLIEIRDNAYKAIEKGEKGKIEMGYKIPVANTLLGSPNFIVRQNKDGTLEPVPTEITNEMLKNVVAVGVSENRTLTLNDKNVKDVNTLFLKGVEGKVPVAIIKFKGRNIAFPLALKKTTVDQSHRLSEIDTSLGTAQQIIHINNILLENGINPSDYQLDPSSSLRYGENAEVVSKIMDVLKNKQDFVDINTWKSENFNLSLLPEQAETYIDMSNQPFDSSKVILSLAKAERTDNVSDIMKEVMEGTETNKISIKSNKLEEAARKNKAEESCNKK